MNQSSLALDPSAPARVYAVIVSYNPDMLGLEKLITAIKPQVDCVLLVDNGSGEGTQLLTLVQQHGILSEFLGKNLGIAAAHNVGINKALAQNFDYVLLLDQDSIPAPDMVAQLVNTHRHVLEKGERIAALGPIPIDTFTNEPSHFIRVDGGSLRRVQSHESEAYLETDMLISSGCLIPTSVFATVGTMNESLFIDQVDLEWCLRARMVGLKLLAVHRATMAHTMGDRVVKIRLHRWYRVSIHSPLRDYYVARNTVFMLLHTAMPLPWRCAHFIRMIKYLVFFSLFIAPRGTRFMRMTKGIWHGLIGRMGVC
jgi:rhamnosyltransferase